MYMYSNDPSSSFLSLRKHELTRWITSANHLHPWILRHDDLRNRRRNMSLLTKTLLLLLSSRKNLVHHLLQSLAPTKTPGIQEAETLPRWSFPSAFATRNVRTHLQPCLTFQSHNGFVETTVVNGPQYIR